MRNTAEVHVGRLLEIRALAGYRSVADVDALFGALIQAKKGLPYDRYVLITDWRRCPVMASEAAQRLIRAMTQNNPSVERSAALTSTKAPTAMMQFTRLVRETNSDARRLFTSSEELLAWVRDVLSPAEMARARFFLQG